MDMKLAIVWYSDLMIEDTNYRDINMAIMKSVIAKGIVINVAIIGHDFGEDSTLINYMKSNAGKIVFANHGWRHDSFALYTNKKTPMYIIETNKRQDRRDLQQECIYIHTSVPTIGMTTQSRQ